MLPGLDHNTLIAVVLQRLSSPSSRRATARTRALPRTMTTASTTPSRGSRIETDPIANAGRTDVLPLAWRARAESTTRLQKPALGRRLYCHGSRPRAKRLLVQKHKMRQCKSTSFAPP